MTPALCKFSVPLLLRPLQQNERRKRRQCRYSAVLTVRHDRIRLRILSVVALEGPEDALHAARILAHRLTTRSSRRCAVAPGRTSSRRNAALVREAARLLGEPTLPLATECQGRGWATL
jgi:hypothetical protein